MLREEALVTEQFFSGRIEEYLRRNDLHAVPFGLLRIFPDVDEVDLERLEDPRLGDVPDPALGHHGDRDGRLDLADLGDGGHPRDAAVPADVGGDPLERHDGAGPRLLGDLRLGGVDHVHDDAPLEHLGEADLHAEGVGGERGFDGEG